MHTVTVLVSLMLSQQLAAKDCIAESLKSRGSLSRDYHLIVTCESYSSDDASVKKADHMPMITKLEIWSSPSKFRSDYTILQMHDMPSAVGQVLIQCKDCERKGYTLTTGKSASRNKVQVVNFEKNEHRQINDFIFDWRMLGMLNNELSAYHRIPYTFSLDTMAATCLNSTDHVNIEGSDCMVLTANRTLGESTRYQIWLDVNKNYSPVRQIYHNGIYCTSTDIQYEGIAGQKFYFPKLIRHVVLREGVEKSRETLTVKLAELNMPVPEKVFTFAGLDLIEGHPIHVPEISDPQKQPTWRNGKLDFEYTSTKQSADAYAKLAQQAEKNQSPLAPLQGPPVPDTAPPSDRWLYFVGAGVLVVLAGVFIVLARKSRKV